MRPLVCSCALFGLAWIVAGCQARLACQSGWGGECVAADESTEDGWSTDSGGDSGAEDAADESDGDDGEPPEAPQNLTLSPSPIKQFDFTWTASADADQYQLLERVHASAAFEPIGAITTATTMSLTVPLFLRMGASYRVRACNQFGCSDSPPVDVVGSLAEAVGYVKASNSHGGDELDDDDNDGQPIDGTVEAGRGDLFGWSVALSEDGSTLAVGALREASSATGIDGDQTDDSLALAGAVYVHVRDPAGGWTQQAYLKASNTDADDRFGWSVALSDDGSTLAVGALRESSEATGIDGDAANNSASKSGAVYVYRRDALGEWAQAAYVKASNTDTADRFGSSVALSGDGRTLAVGAMYEDGGTTGIDGDQTDNAAPDSGAVYVFARTGPSGWAQQAYLKASNTDAGDSFGSSVALSEDGDTLAVGADFERSSATGIDADQTDNSAFAAGAVYVFTRDPTDAWSQAAYLKASNTDAQDRFGYSVALSADGRTLAVGATSEASSATGIGGDQADDSMLGAGAVYVFARSSPVWSQLAYVKASNTDAQDRFGHSVALNHDGSTLAVGALAEQSDAIGIDGQQDDDDLLAAGAVYVFTRDPAAAWAQESYVKAPNSDPADRFGCDVALSKDGQSLAVGAEGEASSATGIGGQQTDDSAPDAGAVYLF